MPPSSRSQFQHSRRLIGKDSNSPMGTGEKACFVPPFVPPFSFVPRFLFPVPPVPHCPQRGQRGSGVKNQQSNRCGAGAAAPLPPAGGNGVKRLMIQRDSVCPGASRGGCLDVLASHCPRCSPEGGAMGWAAGTAARGCLRGGDCRVVPMPMDKLSWGAKRLSLNAELALRYLYFDVYTLSLIK